MDMNTSCGAVHVLVLPMPALGHINPMLLLSKQLAARGFIITFVNTDTVHKRMLETHPYEEDKSLPGTEIMEKRLDIRFEVMPDGSQEPLAGSQPGFQPSNAVTIVKGMESQQGVIEEMVVRSRATPHPITCIISDSFFPWTCPLATKLGIQRVVFWTSNGATFATCVEVNNNKWNSTDASDGEMVAGIPIGRSEVRSLLPFDRPEVLKLLAERIKGLKDAACVVLNTFEELEGASLEAVASCEAKVHYIGPLLPLGNHNAALSVNFYKEEGSCIAWLDKQAPSSVLHVSFGSIASLAPQELEELAFGIEESKRPFLWVSRDSDHHLFPGGFLERTRDRGLVVKWAPQIQVLRHIAIGGFLSHCGWNSVLESICMGVPMLCYPIMFDQHLNALLVTRVWKLGIGLSKEEGKGLVTREEIQRGVSCVLSSKDLHLNSSTWSGASYRSLQQGGSSYLAMEKLIDIVRNYHPT